MKEYEDKMLKAYLQDDGGKAYWFYAERFDKLSKKELSAFSWSWSWWAFGVVDS